MFKEMPILDRYHHLPMEIKKISDHKGHGVFILEEVPQNTVVEVAPIMIYHEDTHDTIRKSGTQSWDPYHVHIIEAYAFEYDHSRGLVCLAMGYGGMYNHAFKPTLKVSKQYEPIPALVFTALRDLKPGDELTHCYSHWEDGLPFDPSPEEGVIIDPISGVMRSERHGSINSYDEFLEARKNTALNFLQIAARERMREERKKKEKESDDRPRLGAWIKARKPPGEDV
jgi:hypothetical protein